MFRNRMNSSALLFICITTLAACVSPAPVPSPTADPVGDATATATPGGAYIQSFFAVSTEAAPGDTVMLRWITSGTYGVEIVKRLPNDTNGEIISGLPSSGETTVRLEMNEVNKVTFILTASTAGDPLIAEVEVKVSCPRAWFFENGSADTCPLWSAEQYKGQGAFQTFEHGQVILNGADGWAVVLFDDGAQPGWTRLYPDWKPGDPEDDSSLTPPDGLSQPIRQIGSVWRSEVIPAQPPRLRLGWATGLEVAIATNYQCDSDAFYDLKTQGAPCYVTGPDGSVIRLSSDPVTSQNSWEVLP